MRCTWRDISEPDARGKRRVQCVRCRKQGVSPYPHEKIVSNCRAWPLFPELGYWLGIVLAACGLTRRRYGWLRRRLGLSPTCACDKRVSWLNRLGRRVADAWTWITGGSS